MVEAADGVGVGGKCASPVLPPPGESMGGGESPVGGEIQRVFDPGQGTEGGESPRGCEIHRVVEKSAQG